MIILASASPRRKELLKTIVNDFKVITADINEEESYSLPPFDAVRDIAYRKGIEIHEKHPSDVVISADTIVILDDQIIGKPKDEEDAKRILRLLSGKKHLVVTAYCIFKNVMVLEKLVMSDVIFNELSDELIDAYVASGSPLDKAGAYGVQDNDKFPIVKEVKGSMNNVIGFPIENIEEDLKYFIK